MSLSSSHLASLRFALATAGLFGPFLLLGDATPWLTGKDLLWTAALDRTLPVGDGLAIATGADVDSAGVLQISLQDPSAVTWLLTLLPTALFAATLSLVAWWLLGIVRATVAGEPFVETSVRNLRFISYAIGTAALLVPLAQGAAHTAVVQAALPDEPASYTFTASTIFLWMLVAAVVRVVAEAFRVGAELRHDTEGLV